MPFLAPSQKNILETLEFSALVPPPCDEVGEDLFKSCSATEH